MEDRTIKIRTLRHATTNLLAAVSDEMKGLLVHGRTPEELYERIPVAIKAMLNAQGHANVVISEVDPEFQLPAGYEPIDRTFNARLQS